MLYLLYNNSIHYYRRFISDLVHIYLINQYIILIYVYSYACFLIFSFKFRHSWTLHFHYYYSLNIYVCICIFILIKSVKCRYSWNLNFHKHLAMIVRHRKFFFRTMISLTKVIVSSFSLFIIPLSIDLVNNWSIALLEISGRETFHVRISVGSSGFLSGILL